MAPVEEVVVNPVQAVTASNGEVHRTVVHSSTKKTLVLYKQKKTKTIYWDFIDLAAERVEDKRLKTYTSNDAVCAWCLKCNCEVTYEPGLCNGLIKHLQLRHDDHWKKHQKIQEAKKTNNTKAETSKGSGTQTYLDSSFTSVITPFMKDASRVDQKMGEALLVSWISTDLRSFKLIEDEGFKRFCEFLNSLDSKFKLIDRIKLAKQMHVLSTAVKAKVKSVMKEDMEYFCVTTDIWTSRTVESFMALTVHYLDSSFCMKEFVLEVRSFGSSHTADNIR